MAAVLSAVLESCASGARLSNLHAERPRALPACRMQYAQTACSLRRSLWVSRGMLEHSQLDGVR